MGQPIRIRARDGRELRAELFEPSERPWAMALIAPAMGVPLKFYRRFGAFLALHGIVAVAVEYRGMDPAGGADDTARLSLRDWGELDLAGAADHLQRWHPALPLLWIGHSVGGQLFGLIEDVPVRAALLIASQSGYWRHWAGARRLLMAGLWHLVVPGSVHLFGRLPMRTFRQGEDVPAGVALEWARWGRHPQYVNSYARRVGGRGFSTYAGPLRAYAFADDWYAPPRSVEALLGYFAQAPKELRRVEPSKLGARSIGHFGFFQERFRMSLWQESLEWIRGVLQPLARPSAPAATAEAPL